MKSCPSYIRYTFLTIFVIYIIFGPLSGYIRPFFTNTDNWKITHLNKEYSFHGTGVFVNKNQVITNHHVVSGCNDVGVIVKGGRFIPGSDVNIIAKRNSSIFNEEIGLDIAIITTTTEYPYVSAISRDKVKINDHVFSPEYTSTSGYFSERKGIVTGLDNETLTVEGNCRKGNSGSPVYDKKGYLIGITHSVAISFTDLPRYYSTNSTALEKILKSNNIQHYFANKDNKSIRDTNYFKNQFAVGIMCSN